MLRSCKCHCPFLPYWSNILGTSCRSKPTLPICPIFLIRLLGHERHFRISSTNCHLHLYCHLPSSSSTLFVGWIAIFLLINICFVYPLGVHLLLPLANKISYILAFDCSSMRFICTTPKIHYESCSSSSNCVDSLTTYIGTLTATSWFCTTSPVNLKSLEALWEYTSRCLFGLGCKSIILVFPSLGLDCLLVQMPCLPSRCSLSL